MLAWVIFFIFFYKEPVDFFQVECPDVENEEAVDKACKTFFGQKERIDWQRSEEGSELPVKVQRMDLEIMAGEAETRPISGHMQLGRGSHAQK